MKLKNEIYEIIKIIKWGKKLKQKNLRNKTSNYINNFQQFETIRSFAENIYPSKISIDEDEMKSIY